MRNGHWIWNSMPCADRPEYLLFRKTVRLDELPESLIVHITADSRYVLYINGILLTRGPARSDSSVKYVDETDIAAHLRVGDNVLAAAVIHYPLNRFEANAFQTGPCSIVSSAHGGLLIYGDERFKTDESYRCSALGAYTFRPALSEYIGYVEEVDGRKYPFGWTRPEFDDSGWSRPVILAGNVPFVRGGLANIWQTQPRNIPVPYETERDYSAVLRSDIAGAGEILKGGAAIPANFSGYAEIEAESYTTGFVRLEIDGGYGAQIEIVYAESYMYDEGDKTGLKCGRRDFKREGSYLFGESDIYIAGTGLQQYQAFHYRSFRFIKLNVKTKDNPLHIRVLPYIETGYPLKEQSDFKSGSPFYNKMWNVSLRTLRCCMYETYMDCPYYEQMQYAMDTGLEALYTYSISRDGRLARKAIRDFYNAQLSNGLIPCNSPAQIVQIIPGFSFYWIFIMDDYYRYFGDAEFIREFFPGVEKALYYFEKCLDERFLLKGTGFWQFVDWVREWETGVPLDSPQQTHFIYSMMYVSALKCASRLARCLNRHDMAAEYKELSNKISRSVNACGYDETDGLYMDTEGKRGKSQHAQIWAVLSGTVPEGQAKPLMLRALSRRDIAECSFSMEHFLFRAMEKADLYDMTEQLWERRRELLNMDVTTWPEDPVSMRSDCHAWSATPLYEFIACGLGVRPEADGFRKVRITPKMLWLKGCSGTAATGSGPIGVKWKIENGVFMITLRSAQPVQVVLEMPDGAELAFTLNGEERFESAAKRIGEKVTVAVS